MTELSHVSLFDYNSLPGKEKQELQDAAYEVRALLKRTAQDIVTIGARLTRAKAMLDHGKFGPWLQLEFGMSGPTARRLMAIAHAYGGKTLPGSVLPVKALYEFATAPEEVREELEAQAEAHQAKTGEALTTAEVQRIKADLMAERDAREAAERRVSELDLRLSETSDAKTAAETAMRDMAKARDADAAKAREDAEALAQSRFEAEIQRLQARLSEAQSAAERTRAEMDAAKARLVAEAGRAADAAKAAALAEAQGEASGIIAAARKTAEAEEAKARETRKAIAELDDRAEKSRQRVERYEAEMRRRGHAVEEANSLLQEGNALLTACGQFMATLDGLEHRHDEDSRVRGLFRSLEKAMRNIAAEMGMRITPEPSGLIEDAHFEAAE